MELSAVVVVPARDEAPSIGACLEALAAQTIGRERFETILVADACTDGTETAARVAADMLGLRLTVLPGPGSGSGAARRLGMDAAAERLAAIGRPGGLIATTDADSTPAPDWLARQLVHLARGARVVAGLIELAPEEVARLPGAVLRRREADASRRFAAVSRLDPAAEHHHFAGASLGLTAELYQEIGGLDPTPALEDEALGDRLRMLGVPVVRAADVRVRTSARATGRARRGLSVDLAVSLWRERRRYDAADFSAERLLAAKASATVAVIIPTKACSETIGGVLERTVEPLRRLGLLDEVVVIDAGRDGETAARATAAGATVLVQDDVLPELGPALGKGDAMWRALAATDSDIVCFLDGDTCDPHPHHLQGLLGPLLCEPGIELVKGSFERPLRRGDEVLAHEGGRVTELMARPLLNLHEPLLAGFAQPLAGEFAGRRSLLEALHFPVGYGVEIAVMIDALRHCGLDALAESRLGTRQNHHQPLRALGEMAYAVLAAVERRLDGPRSLAAGHYLRPWEDGTSVRVPVDERPPLRSLGRPLERLRSRVMNPDHRLIDKED